MPSLVIVGDAGESAAQFDGGGKLAVALKGGADGVGVVFGNQKHDTEVRLCRVAGKRCLGHGCLMFLLGLARLKSFLLMTRRSRARLAKLDATRAEIVAVADALRDLSSRLDARAHLIRKAARDRHGAAPGGSALDPDRTVMRVQVGDAVSATTGIASTLDQATEKLERLAAALRER